MSAHHQKTAEALSRAPCLLFGERRTFLVALNTAGNEHKALVFSRHGIRLRLAIRN